MNSHYNNIHSNGTRSRPQLQKQLQRQRKINRNHPHPLYAPPQDNADRKRSILVRDQIQKINHNCPLRHLEQNPIDRSQTHLKKNTNLHSLALESTQSCIQVIRRIIKNGLQVGGKRWEVPRGHFGRQIQYNYAFSSTTGSSFS